MRLKNFIKQEPLFLCFFLSFSVWLAAFPRVGYGNSSKINSLRSFEIKLSETTGLVLNKIGLTDNSWVQLPSPPPLFSLLINDKLVSSSQFQPVTGRLSMILTADRPGNNLLEFDINQTIKGTLTGKTSLYPGLTIVLRLKNITGEKVKLENLVPAGQGTDRVYITAGLPDRWPHYLSRTLLYRPGKTPVGVLLPDNAWHLGFCHLEISPGLFLTGLARRTGRERAEFSRWAATLEPGGTVDYELYFDVQTAPSLPPGLASDLLFPPEPWLAGLKMMFQERYLYDLRPFDNTLFERSDLQWIRKTYLMLLQFAWDHTYYDWAEQKSNFYQHLSAWDKLVGKIDIYALWPTWPRLGLDERNQFDLYRDLPGGLAELRRQVAYAHQNGKKYFLAYNPWDEGTRHEGHLQAMENLLREIQADGVILDTRGESSREFQAMADRVKPGIILYPEGMAIPKNMPGVVAGRVHDALYLPPLLNLNKFIKPDFAIFRVIQPGEGRFRREASVAFFNGYGTEINTMRPARPETLEDDLRHLGRTLKILRENNSAFLSHDWIPLYPSLEDGISVNCWPTARKIIFTIFSLKPEGYKGALIPIKDKPGFHAVSLWRQEEIRPEKFKDLPYLPVEIEAFARHELETRMEGSLECLAIFPELIEARRIEDRIIIKLNEKPAGGRLVLTAGNPDYDSKPLILPPVETEFGLWEKFGRQGNKLVIQLFESGGELLDERVLNLPPALPRLISQVKMTEPASRPPAQMVEIPAGEYLFKTEPDPDDPNPIIPYPDRSIAELVKIRRFFIDRYPVTNAQFAEFLKDSGYRPADPTNFLKHWSNGRPPADQKNHPVVWVSLKDAEAYAIWAGKRLPTETEWQYAAQGPDGRIYPWGNDFDPARCNNKRGKTESVTAHPSGASPFGVEDLVGNVWQLTSDVYDNGAYNFVIIKGGSYYSPESSVWYPKSGPLPLNRQQMLLLLAPALDRCATVGFRCVRDATQL
ncbi:MAG TPA: SUMF1/EgtB/PvdO family nonheme iron enzyme [Candidatus Saccharicenans sp.]|nr:SUMF1/EgtB/PvdO family nonheme iron enzyme [Candidatus Saccharicenans sp.]